MVTQLCLVKNNDVTSNNDGNDYVAQLIAGMVYNIGKTLGRMEFQELIVQFQQVGIGHMSFKLKIRQGVFSTSLP